jgi:hypothetical protein
MATEITGSYYSDLLVGQKEDVSDDLALLVPAQTPFLNSIGFPGGAVATNTTHSYLDDAYVPAKTTLNGAISATTTTTFVLTDAIAKPGMRIRVGSEVILLGSSTNNLTFTGCTRSVGTPAASTYSSGDVVTVLGKGEAQGAALGTADVGYEPRSVTNYVQEWEKAMDVPDITNNSQRYGRPGNAYDDDAVKKLRDLKVQMEESALYGVATAPTGSSGTAGWMGGFVERVVGTNTTAMGTTNFTQSSLRTAVEAIGAYADPDVDINAVLLCPIHQTFVFDGWQQAHIISENDPLVQRYGVRVRRLLIGPMTVDVIPSTRRDKDAMLYQPNFIKWLWYTNMSPKHEMLARDGRRQRGMITAASTMEVRCPEAHYYFSGLSTS